MNKLKRHILEIVPISIVVILGVLMVINPEGSESILANLQYVFTDKLGFTYMIFGVMMLIVASWLVLSRHGKLVLGSESKSSYNTFTWGSMVVAGTFAADLLYWSFIEWGYYYGSTPKGNIMSLADAQDAASMYPLFHWGPIPWLIYLVPAVAYAYRFYITKDPECKLSSACKPMLGNKINGILGKIIDVVALVGLLAGTATTFSVVTPLMSTIVSDMTGIPNTSLTTIVILLIIAVIYTISVLKGLKGISKLSKVCAVMFGILIALIFIPGPKSYIIESGVSGIGIMVNNFIGLSTWMDPAKLSNGFTQSWTIFYWAYWVSWAVATPLFIAKISHGMSIREIILKGLGCGLLGTYMSFIVIGNTSLYQQVSGTYDASGALMNGETPESVITTLISNMPLSNIIMIMLFLTMIILYATTFDSLSLVIAEYSSGNPNPTKYTRVLWASVFIILPIILVYNNNALSSLKMLSIVAAFPLMIVLTIIVLGLIKNLRDRHKE